MSEHADTPNEKTDISSKSDMQDTPIPKSNWSALAAIICAVTGLVIGFIVPVVGFLFYILGGALGLVFSLISLGTFRKYGLPRQTVGALICSIFLLFWGIFHLVMFPITIISVASFLQGLIV